MRRVVITGMGAVTPLGNDVESTWHGAVEGRSGVDFMRAFDTSDFPVHIAAEVKDFDLNGDLVPAKELKRIDRNVQFALAAASEALGHAGKNGYQPDRVGVVLGSGIGGLHELLRQYDVLKERGPDRVSPTFLPNVLPDSASGQVAIALGLRGPNYAVVSACATGSHAIGEGAELVRHGHADAVLAGGTEACIHPLFFAGFCSMRGLVSEEEDPAKASRPFDLSRAGFVMGEGAGIVMLEELEHARERGATLYAEVLGYGASNDAYHMAAPDPDSVGVAEMMRAALDRAGVDPVRVDYINAHGTSTPLGDTAETKAIKDVFGGTPTTSPSPRRSRRWGICSVRPARSRRSCRRSRSTTSCCPRRSTTTSPIRPATSTTCPTRRGRRDRRRPVERDGPRRPQRLRPFRKGVVRPAGTVGASHATGRAG